MPASRSPSAAASGGKRTPPQIQRMASEDLIAVLFPDQIACAENLSRPARDPRSPAGQADAARLPARGHGHRWPARNLLRGARERRRSRWSRAICRRRRRWPRKSSPRGPTPSSTTRRSKSAARIAVAQRRWLDPESRRGHRQARSRGHRHGARAGVAGSREPRRTARCHARHGRHHRAGRRERRLGSPPRRADRRAPRHAAARRRPHVSGSAPSVCRWSRRSIHRAALDPRDRAPAGEGAKKSGSAKPPSPISCAAGCRAWARSPRATWPSRSASRTPRSASRSSSSKAKASCCAGVSPKRRARPRPSQLGDATLEWCERRLLARIHRYTIKTLRAEIEPVARRGLHALPVRMAGRHARARNPKASRASPR